MAAMYSKGLPQSVQQLAQGSQHSLHRDYASPSTFSHSPSAFRSDASSSSSLPSDEFGSFASPSHYSSASSPPPPAAFNDAWSSPRLAGVPSAAIKTTRNSSQDGAEVAAFLSDASISMFDAIDGHWEGELAEKQNESWRREQEEATPVDPFASEAARAARDAMSEDVKGKGTAAPMLNKGDMSPTSSELLSSLSSLDLSSRAYLRTLVSLPPDLALEDYLAHGLYTDDVYGLPDGVRRLFETAAAGAKEGEDAAKVEEGRMKAVRRLGMVMQHLRAAEVAGLNEQTGRMSLEERMEDVGGTFSSKWVQREVGDGQLQRAPVNQIDAVFNSPSLAAASLQQQQQQQQQQQSQSSSAAVQTAVVAPSSQPMVFPSSLSSSAFITMLPPPAPSSTLTPQPARQASSPPVSHSQPHPQHSAPPLPSFASYFKDQHRRMVSNNGGRTGVDFTSRLVPSPGLRRGFGAGVWGDGWREELRVTEGRTH